MSLCAGRSIALLDANFLRGVHHRNLLLNLAKAGSFRPRWSARILDETQNAITKITGNIEVGVIQRNRIENAFPEAMVVPDGRIEENLGLPDTNDKHVLAAAISASASVIVTDNLRHFPARNLSPHTIEALKADTFIANTLGLDLIYSITALKIMPKRLKIPPLTADEFIEKTSRHGLRQVAAILNKHKKLL